MHHMALHEITVENTHRLEEDSFPDSQLFPCHGNPDTALRQDSSAISPQLPDRRPGGS